MPEKLISPRMLRYTMLAIYIVIAMISLVFLYLSIQNLRFPYGVVYGETPIINQANRIIMGDVLYKNDFNSPPYIVTNYTPIYIYLLAIFNSSFGINLFLSGRLISITAALISGALLTIISYKITKKYFISAIALGLFLGHPYVVTWSSVARVDLLALSFSLLGIYTVLFHWRSDYSILLAVALFTAAIYTRQTYLLAGPLGVSVWLFKNDRIKSIKFITLLLILNIAAFILLNIFTKNGFFLNIVSANVNEYSIARLFSMVKNFLFLWPFVMLIVVYTMTANLPKIRVLNEDNPTNKLFFLIPYSVGAIISTLAVGKVGSDINYFLELIVALILISAVGLSLFETEIPDIRLSYRLIILIQIIWTLAIILTVNLTIVLNRWQKLEWYDNLYQKIETSIKYGDVLSDDYLDMVVLAGQQIYYQSFEYGQLFKAGIWNPSKMVMEIEEKEFPLIVIGGNDIAKECCWPMPVSEAIVRNYKIMSSDQLQLCEPDYE